MLTSQSIAVKHGFRILAARASRAGFVMALGLSACAVSTEGPPSAEETSTAASALTPTIRFTAPATGGPVAFSPNGTRLVTGAAGAEQAKSLSVTNGSVAQTFAVEGAPDAAAFSGDGKLLAVGTAGLNLNLSLFRVADGQQLFQVTGHTNATTAVHFSPSNPNLFATAGRDRTTKIWNINGTLVRTMNDVHRVQAMAYSPDGATVASNAGGDVHIWRVADGTLLRTIVATNQMTVAYSPDGTIISTGTQLFNVATGALIRNLAWPATGSVTSTTFTKNGAAVVVGGEDFPNNVDVATIRYFRVADGAILRTFDHLGGDHAYVQSVAISPDGSALAYGVATDNVTVLAASPF